MALKEKEISEPKVENQDSKKIDSSNSSTNDVQTVDNQKDNPIKISIIKEADIISENINKNDNGTSNVSKNTSDEKEQLKGTEKKQNTELIESKATKSLVVENSEKSLIPNTSPIPKASDKTKPPFSQPVAVSTGTGRKVFKVFQSIILVIIALLVLAYTVFTVINMDNSKISSGISVLGVDISNLERDAAIDKISTYIQDSLENNDIILKHNDFETNIGPEQIETKVNVTSAIDSAYETGSDKNIFTNSFKKLSLMITPVDIKPRVNINQEQLASTLNDISTQLPDAVKQSDYYIDGKNLVVTPGKSGVVIDTSIMSKEITEKVNNLSFINNPIEIATIEQKPASPDVESIYNEVHKEAKDANFNPDTHVVYPEENGLDFSISIDEAKAMLAEEKEEYTIPLKVLYPSVTTNMIGMEAFPNLLSSFSTKYPASNRDRTTNLRLAASKIDGTVVLPGETFSYNAVVGARTIAAGYKEAAVYQDGQVVQGLGGGICQISTTLFNAALYANLDIVERRNHQFVPSYIGAGRDATVVYGSQDFKFKNNRNYAIKITCSVEGGVASFQIYGLEEPDDCEVTISANITSRNANSFTSATYKTLSRNGEVISSETIARDTYKAH